MISIFQISISFLIGLVLVYFCIPIIVKICIAKNLYDVPNERRMNKFVVPNLGGVALFFGISVSTLLSLHTIFFPEFRSIMAAMIILFFIGIKDDILVISPYKKLFAQIISAAILILFGAIRFTSLHGILGIFEINYLTSFFISLVAIVAIINALNLIDGIDGLAAATGILSSIIFGSLFFMIEQYNYSILCFATAGSLTSFFIYNVYSKKNKIFMGDTGSLIIGMVLSAVIIKFNEFNISEGSIMYSFSPIFSIAVISVPLFDMIRLFVVRIIQKKSPFHPDINHIHHKILKMGHSHLKTTSILIIFNLLIIGIAFVFSGLNNNLSLILLGFTVTVFSFIPSVLFEYEKSKRSVRARNQYKLLFMQKNEHLKFLPQKQNPEISPRKRKLQLTKED